jgi:antitoxin VapB
MINLSLETETVAVQLAAAQRLSVEAAIRRALETQARAAGVLLEPRRPRDQSPEAVAARHARTDRFVAEIASMPVLDPRSPREIMDDLNAPYDCRR